MAGRLSFSIAINLLTENFKKGTNSVKAGFRAMQMQVLTFAAALGAGGLGLSNFISRLIDVARETNRVNTALKNVSGSLSKYSDNQRFVIDMAKKYGIEVNALTGNFAKFTAAASVSGMSMDKQRKIFESVSRACTAFGMSADDSNGVFLALSQMMSKGKISSEELRLQMGERLPIALQAMAKAAGVSVGKLDKLLKQGKLMSADVLPKFADALNEMIPNVDTDNLETSVNRLKNAFTDFTNNTNIQSYYKNIIDWLTGAVQSAGENITNIVTGVIAVISGLIAKSVVGWWGVISSSTSALEAAALRSNSKLIAATKSRIAAEIALEEAKVAVNNATGNSILAAKKRVAKAEKALISASNAEQIEIENVKSAELKILDSKRIADVKITSDALAVITRKRIAAEIELEEAKNGIITANSTQVIAAQKRLSDAQIKLAKLTTKEVAATEAAKAAAAQAAAVKSSSWWTSACNTMKAGAAKLVVSLKAMWSSFAPMVIVSAISWIVMKLIQAQREAKRLKNLFSDFKKEAANIGDTQEIKMLQTQLGILNDKKSTHDQINLAQSNLLKSLGIEKASQTDLNKLVAKRIELLKAAAKANFYSQRSVETEDLNKNLANKYGMTYNQMLASSQINHNIDAFNNKGDRYRSNVNLSNLFDIKRKYKVKDIDEFRHDLKEFFENQRIINYSDSELKKSQVLANQLNATTTPPITDDDDDKEKKTEFEKAQEKYAKSLLELDAELKINKITQQEYNKALDELNQSALVEAMTIKDGSIAKSEYFKKLQQNVANPTYNESQAQAEKAQKEYNEELDKYKNRLAAGNLSQKQYDEKVKELNSSTLELIASILGASATTDEFYQNLLKNTPKPDMPVMPQFEDVDHTFDYKKTDLEKRQDEYEVAKGNLDKLKSYQNELKDKFPELAKEMEKEINDAMSNVKTMGEALKLEEVREDIKNLSKELNEGLYSGVKGVVGNIDGMVSAFQRVSDVMSDVDASGWERIMAVWEAMTSTVDSILQIIEIINTLTKVIDSLALAKEKEVAIDSAATTTKVANAEISAGADIMEAGVKKSTASETVAANTAESASETGKSAAKSLPFPLNILAIAGAIAATYAAFSAISKFANGGIVGGNSYSGDKILAGVNSGEMIFNQSQQRRLFEIANGKGNIGGGSSIVVTGEAKLRGDTAFIQIANYMKRTGKRLPR